MPKYIAIFNESTFNSYGIGKHAIAVVHEDLWRFRPCDDRGNGWLPRNPPIDFEDLIPLLGSYFGINIDNPQKPICICPETCDCQDPEHGFKSNECPIHNEEPTTNPECLAELHRNNLIDTIAGNYARSCGAECFKAMSNSYIWRIDGVKDISLFFDNQENLIVGLSTGKIYPSMPGHTRAKTLSFGLADPQLENKLKSLVDGIRNAS